MLIHFTLVLIYFPYINNILWIIYIYIKLTHNAYNYYLNIYKIVNTFVIIKCVHLHQNVCQMSSFRRYNQHSCFFRNDDGAAFHSVANEENQGKCHEGLTSTQTTQQDNLHNSYTACTRLYSLDATTSWSHHNHNFFPSSALSNCIRQQSDDAPENSLEIPKRPLITSQSRGFWMIGFSK